MSKNFLVKLIVLLGVLATGILWLLSIIKPDIFGAFNVVYACAIVCGVIALAFLFMGLFYKVAVISKKLYFILAIIFAVGCACCLFNVFGVDSKIVAPIIFIIVVAGLIVSLVGTSGKAWDEGDNQKAGYKNYYQRKAEEEKAKKDENEEK